MAFGQMGIDPADFWRMSWRDFNLKQRGFFEQRKADYQVQWEQVRFVAYWAASGFLKKGTRMADLIKFDWDKKAEAVDLTEEQMDYWLRKVGNRMDKDGRGYNA